MLVHTLKYLTLLSLVLTFFSCEKSTVPCNCVCEVEGEIVKKDAEKDGYSVIIADDNNQAHYAIISIANLDSYYQEVELGDQVLLRGECFELDSKHHITPDYLEKK